MGDTIQMLKCANCNYEWYPRTPVLPKVCPNCKHRNWQKKRTDVEVATDVNS